MLGAILLAASLVMAAVAKNPAALHALSIVGILIIVGVGAGALAALTVAFLKLFPRRGPPDDPESDRHHPDGAEQAR
jgi:uncharacterized membrane protein YdfJ with MMPL/SSD domain